MRDCIHNTSFPSQLTNGPNKPEGATTFSITTVSIMAFDTLFDTAKLSVLYAECRYAGVTNKPIMLSVVAPAIAIHYTRVKILLNDKTL
jgi:hypothetical protein